MSKQPRERTGSNSTRATDSKHAVWVRDYPARVWLTKLRDSKTAWDLRPTPFDRWMNGKPTSIMLKKLPKNVAEIGLKRIRDLGKAWRSSRRASMKLVWKARRVKYKPSGEPSREVNTLRRLEENSIQLGDAPMLEMILKMAKANNARWFIKLAIALETGRNPRTRLPEWFPDKIDRIAKHIQNHWFLTDNPATPPLCYFTDQALADVCAKEFPTAKPTLDSVRKWRKRLALVRPGPPIVNEV